MGGRQDNLEEGTEISPTIPVAFYSPQDQIRSSLFRLFPARSRSLTMHGTETATLQLRDFRIMYASVPTAHADASRETECSFLGMMNGKSDFIYPEIGGRPPFRIEMDFLGARKIGFVSRTIEMEKLTVLKIIPFYFFIFFVIESVTILFYSI